MPDMREGDLGTAACYLTVERLALQAGVESPFWDEASLLMGGCEEPWYKKPLTPRRLRSFLKRYGGSLPDDAGRRGHAASVFADVMRLHGIPMEDGADNLGALYVRRAESVGMTVAFLATGCTLADMAAITGFCEEARLLPQFLSPFVPPHQGVPRQVGSRDVRMEERQALRCRHNEGDLRRGDLLPCAQDRRQGGLVLGHELWKALGASWEGHRMTGGPSLACGGFAACRRYGGYYIPIILAL